MSRILLQVKHKKLKAAREGRRPPLRPADMARELEITPQAFFSYEGGVNRVPADVLIKWCELLELQPADVIVEEDKQLIVALAAA